MITTFNQSLAMDANEVEQLIDEKMSSSLRGHRQEMLQQIQQMMEKISGSSSVSQLNKLSTLVNGAEKFKRKSNEEQFKYNSNVSLKLEEAEQDLEAEKIQEGRVKIAEGNLFCFSYLYVCVNCLHVYFSLHSYFRVLKRSLVSGMFYFPVSGNIESYFMRIHISPYVFIAILHDEVSVYCYERSISRDCKKKTNKKKTSFHLTRKLSIILIFFFSR